MQERQSYLAGAWIPLDQQDGRGKLAHPNAPALQIVRDSENNMNNMDNTKNMNNKNNTDMTLCTSCVYIHNECHQQAQAGLG